MKGLFYLGRSRQVRVWDEAIVPSQIHTLSRFEIQRLLDGFSKAGYGAVAKALDEFSRDLSNADRTSLVQMPELEIDREEALSLFDSEADERSEIVVRTGWQSTSCACRQHWQHGVSDEDILPSDIAPMLILDASGQQRKTYELWYKGRLASSF